MHSKRILLLSFFALMQSSYSRPKYDLIDSERENESKAKEWESRKPDIFLLKQLEENGLGIRKVGSAEEKSASGESNVEEVKSSSSASTSNDLKLPTDFLPYDDKSTSRVKKQSLNNVCIKVGGCGKTACGSVVSARGPVVGDMRAIMQGAKPLTSLAPSDGVEDVVDLNRGLGKTERFSPVHGRTVDLMSFAPAVSVGYGTPAVYSAPLPSPGENNAIAYGHSFIKPPSIATVPAMPVAVITQHQPHPIIHPWMMSHLLPHIMPHIVPSIMPSLASFVTPHRFESQRFPELWPTDIKQPSSSLPQYSYAGGESALICQPLRNQRFDNSYEYLYKPDAAIDKSLNVSDAAKKYQSGPEDDSKIQDHLRKVNEIKDEISQLNRAAQKIVDQQERLAEMQQKQLWSGSSASSGSSALMHGADHSVSPYVGNGYYSHPTMPWGYSRSNILSYPNTHDDIDFFLNLLRAGKKFGVISDSLQPVLSTVGEAIKGTQEPSKVEKNVAEGAKSASRTEDFKTTQAIKSA